MENINEEVMRSSSPSQGLDTPSWCTEPATCDVYNVPVTTKQILTECNKYTQARYKHKIPHALKEVLKDDSGKSKT